MRSRAGEWVESVVNVCSNYCHSVCRAHCSSVQSICLLVCFIITGVRTDAISHSVFCPYAMLRCKKFPVVCVSVRPPEQQYWHATMLTRRCILCLCFCHVRIRRTDRPKMTYRRRVFFNLFAAAEPYVSVKIAHGNPCTDLRVQRNRRSGRRSESFAVLPRDALSKRKMRKRRLRLKTSLKELAALP